VPDRLLHRVRARHGRRAAVVSIALLGLLIADNLRWAVHIDRTRPPAERFHRSSRSLFKIASQERNFTVSGRLAGFYLLAKEIGGARLIVPVQLAAQEWMLERVSRLDVVVDSSALRVDPARLDVLRDSATVSTDWFVRGRRRASRVWGKLHIQRDPTATEYVLATTPRDQELFVVPREVYDANFLGVGPAAP
jgi:hypothetical protein